MLTNKTIPPTPVLLGQKKGTLSGQKEHHAKDELEYATNWRRAFTNIFTHLKWLNAFG